MSKEGIVAWTFQQLMLTGLFDNRVLASHAREPWPERVKLVLADFQALKMIGAERGLGLKEAADISRRFAALRE